MNIIESFGAPTMIRRHAPGDYVVGRWIESGTIEEFSITAYIEPITGEELLQRTEGRRTEDLIKVFSKERLYHTREEEKRKGDLVFFDGKIFEVFSSDPWNQGGFGGDLEHYVSIAHRQEIELEAGGT